MNSRTLPDAMPATRLARVMLADDHHVTLWGLQQLILATTDMTVSGTAQSGSALLTHPALSTTDVVVLDLGLSARNSLDVIHQLAHEHKLKVVVLTGSTDPAHHRDAIRRGARGIVLKNEPAHAILDAIATVYRGDVRISEGIVNDVLQVGATHTVRDCADATAQTPAARRIAALTPKEREVIRMVVKHRSAKALVAAQALGISENTLRNHLTVIYSKLGLHGKVDLFAFAMEHQLN